ncbi:FMN-dependent NADH-azoreductase [Burkholderia cenocepacia]|uniref:FMN-dependent NADH-azoreductase n=1 Tax=Burkholderia cenocepacia TaxID=95486 RepID=UPI0019063604|nr:FMN-dependent NADH-azoreductase [Burkholderia cenocepacia]MBJ9895561.1 FMN-dependent NADH-azoreductase [Burkholderia cenocepacia]MBJ9915103.1 FMN-dependent NADH-azoreductase [Burkholderia cenocepacia]MBR8114590.1 FMN-dependent NADH-azoreductase [Burkholderia cenocepacia]MBR8369102.1 FMN-dependent NADH-azoreductase [Burkholderia cenocepacia]MBR8385015.1 FMN-dependent NADH-azoreductase [Burkholderia cenocepacia]
MKILHLDSSILDDNSITRALSAAVVADWRARHPSAEVTYRDLVRDEIAHLTGPIAAGFRDIATYKFDDDATREHRVSETLVTEFLASNVIVVGAPMYNFSVPSQLKAWLDRVAQAGRTFRYTEHGPVGLATDKSVVVVSARGGFYAEGPLVRMDFQENYLKSFFGFLGITDVRFVRAEGASKGQPVRDEGIARARAAIADVLAGVRTPDEQPVK